MTDQDWITVYQQSLPIIEGHRGSAISTSATVIVLCIFMSIFIYALMKKRQQKMGVKNVLLILAPIILSTVTLGSSFWKHFKEPYAITGKVEKKWISGRYDVPMISVDVSSANLFSETGKGSEVTGKSGLQDFLATNEIYEPLEIGEELILLSMGNDQIYGRIKGEKLLVPLPPVKEIEE